VIDVLLGMLGAAAVWFAWKRGRIDGRDHTIELVESTARSGRTFVVTRNGKDTTYRVSQVEP
jgi:hypothetical protein